MRLQQIETFVVVCESGSISRAAELLHVAQPALGLQIRGLEEDLGAQLLKRHARGVEPTAAGRLALAWARETLARTRTIKDHLRNLSAGLSGPVTLGMTPSTATAFALPVLAEVQRDLPEVRLQLHEALSHVLKEWVQAGRVDLALVLDAPGVDDALPRLLTERLYFVTSRDAAAGATGPVALSEVLDQTLAMPVSPDAVRSTFETAARAIGRAPRIEYQMQSLSVLLKLVGSGLAGTVMPMPLVMDAVAQGVLSARRIESPALIRHLHWAVSAAATQLPATGEVQRRVEAVVRRMSVDPLLREAYQLAEP